jgi:transposase-like protein
MRKIISLEEKAVIMSKVRDGSAIKELARIHGISRGTIHCWIRKNRRRESKNTFIEVPIIDSKSQTRSEDEKRSNIQKAFFEFNKFSFAIEGKVEKRRIIKILQILEEVC